jgi:hypothetical protein
MELWDFVMRHLAEIISIAVILFGFIKLLGHISMHLPETNEREQRWQQELSPSEIHF